MIRVVVLVAVFAAVGAQPALAWDPFAERERPAPSRPSAAPTPTAPAGLYLVTDVYDGDVVIRTGSTTVYTTNTVRQTPGTYARVVDVVGTGQRSRYDGAAFNGRGRLPDGRLVAGTYYEDFVLTPRGFTSVNIVFFQDDSVTIVPPPPAGTPPPSARPTASPARALPAASSTPRPSPRASPPPRPLPAVTAGVALAPTGPTLDVIEVLRGRRVALWPRAFVDGMPVAVTTWRLVSGRADVLEPTAGGGGAPCVASWLTMPDAGVLTLQFEVTTEALPGRVLLAAIRVWVRSPALLQ